VSDFMIGIAWKENVDNAGNGFWLLFFVRLFEYFVG